ncbi:MAG: hypothetical protein B6242_09645 [Anaerolineaceae bacterium 4572_78]|nr:MAG: hypothetical protein B6242_09645 [Anaerolineaceae bacterium 4572_78]
MKSKSIWLGLILVVLSIPVLLIVSWRLWLNFRYAPKIYYQVDDVPKHDVAIVFGAGLYNGRPSHALADRIEVAVDLYHAGKVKKLLMTGDNSIIEYNEPEAMRKHAHELGVSNEDIVLDYAGRRTYDSCYRAKEIFEVDQAILITQRFHQPRAIYLCDQLGMQGVGFVADKHNYYQWYRLWWEIRETLATSAAWWDINISHPVPILGEKLPIR